MSTRGRRKRKSLTVNTDLKLMPLMNIIIALIPMLLLSSVFLEVKVIQTSLPRDADATTASTPMPDSEPLDLAVHVRADAYVIEGHGLEPRVLARRPGTAPPDSVTAGQLTQVLKAMAATHPGTTEVRIVAEARTHYQEIISLMDAARAAGLVNPALEGSSPEEV